MGNAKILYVAQEIYPFLPESPIANTCRYLPQLMQEQGKEIRTFMPKFGCINERRNQLHEVIRLSGMNLVINDTDYPLIIKVASIQSARMQVYFIDNEDYFNRKAILTDENCISFTDNDERSIFFARGVIETIKKLRWSPDIIHCHGWFTLVLPLMIRYVLNQNPLFDHSKLVVSLYNDNFNGSLDPKFGEKLLAENIPGNAIKWLTENTDYHSVMKTLIDTVDAIIIGEESVDPAVLEYAKVSKKPMLEYLNPQTNVEELKKFYDQF